MRTDRTEREGHGDRAGGGGRHRLGKVRSARDPPARPARVPGDARGLTWVRSAKRFMASLYEWSPALWLTTVSRFRSHTMKRRSQPTGSVE